MTPGEYITALKDIGFSNVNNKYGVLEKFITKRDEPVRLIALVSNRDTSLLVYCDDDPPFKFHFKRNYAGAHAFITDYIGDS